MTYFIIRIKAFNFHIWNNYVFYIIHEIQIWYYSKPDKHLKNNYVQIKRHSMNIMELKIESLYYIIYSNTIILYNLKFNFVPLIAEHIILKPCSLWVFCLTWHSFTNAYNKQNIKKLRKQIWHDQFNQNFNESWYLLIQIFRHFKKMQFITLNVKIFFHL